MLGLKITISSSRKKYRLLAILVVFTFIACNAAKDELYEMKTEHKDLIMRHSNLVFSKDRWANASNAERGMMVRSLFNQHKFIGKKNSFVSELLGFSTCYVNYEDQPCYEVIYDDNRYFLVFHVNHSNDPGRVLSIELFARD